MDNDLDYQHYCPKCNHWWKEEEGCIYTGEVRPLRILRHMLCSDCAPREYGFKTICQVSHNQLPDGYW